MKTMEMTCIRCPMGCRLTVTQDGDNFTVTGNTCRRGEEYGRKEVTNPTRIVTSSVRVVGSTTGACTVSCKTASDIPKSGRRSSTLPIRMSIPRRYWWSARTMRISKPWTT